MTVATRHPSPDALRRAASATRPGSEEHAFVRDHLRTGCDSCEESFEDLVREAATCGPLAEMTRSWLRPKRVRHSRGVRSGAIADYQIICGAGPYELDVLVQDAPAEERLAFIGQVTWGNRTHEPVRDLELTLISAPRLDRAVGGQTDEFGEFRLSPARRGMYGLQLGGLADAPCVMVWEGWDA